MIDARGETAPTGPGYAGAMEVTLMNAGTRDARLMEAVEFMEHGAWQDAHAIVQQDKSIEAAWLHGIVHTLEGDLENARHWYRKADRAFPGPGSVAAELAAARELLAQTT
jgi:Tfp pilus assembly protein PilF